jgi:hypothetical protein
MRHRRRLTSARHVFVLKLDDEGLFLAYAFP